MHVKPCLKIRPIDRMMVLLVCTGLLSCDPHSGESNIDDSHAMQPASAEGFQHCEDYPDFNPMMAYNEVVPPLGWGQAFRADGSQHNFSFEDFFCGESYVDKHILIFVIGAGWCQACSRLVETSIDPIAGELVSALGAELVYLQIQDTQRLQSGNQAAYRHFLRLIGDGPGWRVGDLDTMIRDGESMMPAPGFITRQSSLPVLPAVWVIRKLITMDREQDWSDPPLPPFQGECEEGEDEETAQLTNNVAEDATIIEPGIFVGGICDSEPDFYAFDIDGSWRFQLEHDPLQGDLDLVLWDHDLGRAALDDDGRIIGSFSAENVETLSGEGPSLVQVRGFGGSSATYTITLESR